MKRIVCLLFCALYLGCTSPVLLFAADQAVPQAVAEVAKININSASATELQSLPGIGKVTAERIIAYRTEKGAFTAIGDIVKVKGVGSKSYEKIKDLITIE